MILCSNCHQSLNENAKFCTNCGTKIVISETSLNAENVMKCSCGAELKPNAKFCTVCGIKFIFKEEKIEDVNSDLCSCGADHKPGAKFCTTCGKKVVAVEPAQVFTDPDKCPCGAMLKPGAKFCVSCGKSVVAPVATSVQPPVSVSVPPVQPKVQPKVVSHPATAAALPRKKKRVFLKVAAAVLIVAVLGGGGYWAYTEFFGGIRKKLLVESKISVSDKDQTVKYEDEIAVTVPFGVVNKEDNMRISSVKGLPDMEGLNVLNAYDIELGDQHNFDGYLEIVISYNPEDIPAGMSPAQALTCNSFNEEKQVWEPVPYMIDESRHQMIIFSDHLSIFAPGVAGEAVQPGPMMKVKKVRFPAGDMMDEATLLQTLERYNSPQGTGTKEGMIAGWDFINEWFGIVGNASSFTENALEVGALEGVNKIATEVGLGFALVQAGIDFSEGKDRKAVLELTKNLSNYAIGKIFNTTAMNIAMVGVFAIDYSLNKFATTAISGRNDIYQKAYDMYYRDKVKSEKINSVWWYKKLLKVAHDTKNTTEAGGNMDKFMHDYVYEFWGNPEVVAEYLEKTGLYSTGFGGLNEDLKKEISENQLKSIVNTLHGSSVFDKLIKQLKLEAMSKLYDKLCYIQGQLNIEYPIKVVLKIDPESEDYKDLDLGDREVKFVVPNPKHKELWKGKTDKDGVWDFRCTALGYTDAGCPTSVEVEIPAVVAGEKPEVFSGEMKLGSSGKTTVVEIVLGSPKLEGTWKLDATCTYAKLDASLQYMDAMADLYGSGDDYRKARAETTESMKGQKAQFPDLVMDGMEYIWKVSKEGGYVVITSPDFDNKKSLGGTQYRIKFNGRKQFTGTIETRSYLGDKENIMKFDVVGTRIK